MISVDEATRAAWSASLRRSPVLRHLSEDRLAGLLDDGELTTFADGATLAGDGSACEAFLLLDGACDVARGEEQVRMVAPALVGEIAVLTGTPTLDRVRAVGAVTAIVIPRERFLAAIRTSAEAGQELTNVVADRLCAPGSIGRVGRFPVEGIIGDRERMEAKVDEAVPRMLNRLPLSR